MKTYLKEFLLSSVFIWVFYFLLLFDGRVTSARDTLEELLLFSGFLFPVYFIIAVLIPGAYILFILRKDQNKFVKGIIYFCVSWILLIALIFVTSPVATLIQNEMYFGGQGEEQKEELLLKAELSIEEKLNVEFELVEKRYKNRGSFSDVAFYLDFKEEDCEEDCQFEQVYLSHEEQGWRMKIINGEIWYLDE